MPMPSPQRNEKRDKFLDRCMGDGVMVSEYPDEEQRYAICNKQWRETMKFKGLNDWVEIFMGGKQIDSEGREHDGDAMIDKAVATFDPGQHEPPAVIGHPEENAPAYAWVEDLATTFRDGVKILLAKFKQVVPEFGQMVEQGLFKKRSASFYPDGRLRHVGFLGAAAPAVKGLKDIGFKEEGIVFEFEAKKPEERSDERGDTLNNTKDGGIVMEKFMEFFEFLKFWKKIERDPDLGLGKPAEGKSFTEAELEQAKKEAAAEAKKETEAAFSDAQKKESKAARDKEIADYVDGLIKEKKIPPAWKDAGVIQFMQALDAENEISFSEEKKESALAWFKSLLGGFGKPDLFSEIATKETAEGSGEFAEAKADAELGKKIAAKVNPPEKEK